MQFSVILAIVNSLSTFQRGYARQRRICMTTALLEALRSSYSAYYDIFDGDAESGLPLAFRASYSSRSEKYWLSKNIKVWANETNEHAYLFAAESFDIETVDRCIDYVLKDGLPRVKPHKEHQYTNLAAIFIADGFDKATAKHIAKRSFSKSYKFSLHGYTELLTAAVEPESGSVSTNAAGRGLSAYFKKLFAANKSDAASK